MQTETNNLPVVFAREGLVLASSRDVAATFEKRHDHVLRDIDSIVRSGGSPNLGNLFFERYDYHKQARKKVRAFDMTRDGFTLLAMGFSGAKALQFKLRFIAAFNAMETALKAADEMPIAPRMEEIELINAHVKAAAEIRRIYGRSAARQYWEKSPLPQIAKDSAMVMAPSGIDPEDDGVDCLAHLLRFRADNRASIGAVIQMAMGDEAARGFIERLGIKAIPDKRGAKFAIAESHPELSRIFAETAWCDDWFSPLLSLDRASAKLTGFGRNTLRAVHLPARYLATIRYAH
ncbi:Rha family transcriptional regulator [Ochrobactrum sp. XJ1]|nr:Rha family transcriptional regulator [Ochrobactrum sp. XJ1]